MAPVGNGQRHGSRTNPHAIQHGAKTLSLELFRCPNTLPFRMERRACGELRTQGVEFCHEDKATRGQSHKTVKTRHISANK